MRNKSLIILSTVVISLGIAAYFLEKSEDEVEASKYIRLPVKADQISRLIIERQNETLDLQSTSDGWIFKQDSMKADTTYVKDLTERIESAEFEPIVLTPGQTLDQFRFEKPALKLTITDHLNRSNTLTMSDRRNFAGEPYFKINQENQIYTLNTDLDKKLMNKMIFFQEKHVFKNQYEEFNKIQVQSLNHRFDVLKVSKLNPAHVTAFVSKLKNMTVQQYLNTFDYCNFKTQTMSVVLSAPTVFWSLRLSLNTLDKKLYAEAQISESGNVKKFCVEYDTSYWAYFSNLSEQQFVKEQK